MTEPTIPPRVWHDILSELAIKLGDHPLPLALLLAVPKHILDLVAAGGPNEADWAFLMEFGAEIAEKGDVLLYGGKKGEAAALFNNLAHAIAIAAFMPGGIDLGSSHFQAMVKEPKKKARKKKGKPTP